jgi:hypothetical protein
MAGIAEAGRVMPSRTQILYATPRCPRIKERIPQHGRSIVVPCNEPMVSVVAPLDRSHWRCPHGHTITWVELVESQWEMAA